MNLHIVTSAEKSMGTAEAWKRQYFDAKNGGWSGLGGKKSPEEIYNEIKAANGDPEKISQAIGNESWSHVECSVCDKRQDFAIEIGEYEPRAVCLSCLGAAKAALEAVMGALAKKAARVEVVAK